MRGKQRLRELFQSRAIQFGDFTLASGQKSRYYLNSKRVLFHPEFLSLLGEALADATVDTAIDSAGGLEVGAIPMTAAYLSARQQRGSGSGLEGFFVRKQAKSHGSQDLIEGQLKSGDRVLILDDVLTTGTGAMKAIQAVQATGATVARVVCICDRLQGAGELLAAYDFRPLFTADDFDLSGPGVG